MPKLTDILKENHKNRDLVNKYKILYLSSLALIPFDELLMFYLRNFGAPSEVKTGLFNSLVTEMKNYADHYDVIIINHDPFSSLLENNLHLSKMTEVELNNLERNYVELVKQILLNIPNNKFILFIGFANPKVLENVWLAKEVKRVTERCAQFLKTLESAKIRVVEVQKLIEIMGKENAFKPEANVADPSPFTLDFRMNLASIVASAVASQVLAYKKLLVLDCDNTLWGGVAAETGYSSLDLDEISPKGKMFLELQLMFKEMKERGVLLALCSKNDEKEVLEVFNENANMVLKIQDFVGKRVNWHPKSQNIYQICAELDLLPDCVVFIDDSFFEIYEVVSRNGGISCLQSPTNSREAQILKLHLENFFLSRPITSEDLQKSQYYQDEIVRKFRSESYLTYDDYLRSLETQVELAICTDSIYIPRISQLSLKTNQFNFMYSRFEEDDVAYMMDNPEFDIFTGKVTDNVGDSGLVLLIVTEKDQQNPKHVRIIELTLSCRVFDRNVAESAMVQIIKYLQDQGFERLSCVFKRSEKNSRFNQFLPSLNFKLASVDDEHFFYVFDLITYTLPNYDYPKIVGHFL